MIIHQTDYLETFFDKQEDLFIQNWRKSPENNDIFKKEMLNFVKEYEKHKPSKALWLHKNFTLILDTETQDWAEKNVVQPCIKYGNKKLAFVVSKDVFSQISIIDSFEDLDMETPRHFVCIEDALKWLTEGFEEENKESSIRFEGIDEEGNMLLKIKTSADATNILKLFKRVQKDENFHNTNFRKFKSLTVREKEILQKFAHGVSLQEISEELNISVFTARTHWRNIKRKLQIRSSLDTVKFIPFY